jgi:hypothetical protein
MPETLVYRYLACLIFRGDANYQEAALGTWRITPDVLARARFILSPKAEIVAALYALLSPLDSTDRAFRAVHREAFEAMLARFPLRRAVLDYSFRPRRGEVPGWLADFLSAPPPARPTVTIDDSASARTVNP